MLSVTNMLFVLILIMLTVVMLNVVLPAKSGELRPKNESQSLYKQTPD